MEADRCLERFGAQSAAAAIVPHPCCQRPAAAAPKLGEFYRQLSMIDGLTDLYNRAWLNDLLPTMIATAHSSHAPLALIMIDLDHFKRFNDSYGHLAGDQALRAAAHVLSSALRPTDFAVRYGGEEMMVLLPDTSDSVALAVAERLCVRMQQAVVLQDTQAPLPHITASFGVACCNQVRKNGRSLLPPTAPSIKPRTKAATVWCMQLNGLTNQQYA